MRVLFRQLGVFLFCAALAAGVTVHGQAPRKKAPAKKPGAGTVAAKPKAITSEGEAAAPADEKSRFNSAIAAATPAEKAELLVRFIADFPKSTNKQRAQESLASARAALADEALTAGHSDQALQLFHLAVDEAPKPYSDRLFAEVIAKIPSNLYWKGDRIEAYEIARAIEANVGTDAKRLAGVANFYLSVEDGTEAKRIAEAAIKLDEAAPAGYMVLGMAHRLNFELDEAEKAFAKAVELDSASPVSKRMLAEMKRALGRSDEATMLYQEILAKDENDTMARTGYVLSLFDAGKRSEAEAEFSRALERTPGNVFLLAGAAYWYAANNDGAKAAELAQQAIAKEPRFIWSHIALARGLMAQGKPVDAEQALVSARKYGNFPTLQYEIASARLAAGFYREAADELRKSFSIDSYGLHSKLGGRIDRTGTNFTELLSSERRASIFTPAAADSPETAEQLKALFELDQALSSEKPDEAKAVSAAERFATGGDQMATYRRLYAAQKLNEKQIAADKALEYSRSAIATVDNALNVPAPGAAVMASELYDARTSAFSNDDFLLIPEVPKQTLSAILRGRIEESTGVALLHAGNAAEATVRFRRALSVVPKDSAWWRSATWNLGRSLEAEGKDEEALRAYVASYKIDKPSLVRYLQVSSLYRKVKGSDEGMEEAIGPNPIGNPSTIANTKPEPVPESSPVIEKPVPVGDSGVEPKRLPRRLPVADVKPIETKPVEAKAEPAPENVDAKPAEPKPEEPRPTEEKKAEPVVEDKKPATDPTAEPKQPETLPSDSKPVEEKKDVPAESKPAEEKKEPVAENSDRPSQEPPKVEEKKEAPPETPVENKPAEEKKDAPAEVNDKPALDASQIPEETPAASPKETKPSPTETEKQEPSPDPPAKRERVVENSEVRQAPSEPVVEEPKPLATNSGAEVERPKRFEVVKTDLTIPPPRANTKATPRSSTETTSKTIRPQAKPDPMRPLFEPVVISVPGAVKDSPASDRVAVTDTTKRCSVGVSQDDITVSGEEGTVAVLVSVDEDVDIASVKGTPNSDEIAVRREPRIAGIDDRIVYLVSSATGKPGMYQVTFAAPCGRRTINVRIR